MQINFTGDNVELTAALKERTTEKLQQRIERIFSMVSVVDITFCVQKRSQIVKAIAHLPTTQIHAKSESENMYAAIDLLLDKLVKEIKKHREKLQEHRE